MMAFGVESRVPFVDHILVEWMASFRSHFGSLEVEQANSS
jgi:hypothetical protein